MPSAASSRALLPLALLFLACAAHDPPVAAGVASSAPVTSPEPHVAPTVCAGPNLVWHKASKTTYTSYPAPGSEECVKYSGCLYEGQFNACKGKQPLAWVQSHNIVAVFPNFAAVRLHDVCLRAGSKVIVATAYDTCADSDCDGCCSKNAQPSGNLIDVESFTDARWGVEDGPIEWADLGPTRGGGCD